MMEGDSGCLTNRTTMYFYSSTYPTHPTASDCGIILRSPPSDLQSPSPSHFITNSSFRAQLTVWFLLRLLSPCEGILILQVDFLFLSYLPSGYRIPQSFSVVCCSICSFVLVRQYHPFPPDLTIDRLTHRVQFAHPMFRVLDTCMAKYTDLYKCLVVCRAASFELKTTGISDRLS